MGSSFDCNGSNSHPPHALVVPSRGQSHINGALQLSQSLSSLGFSITFVYFSTYYSVLKDRNRLVLPNPDEAISFRILEDGFGPGDSAKLFFVPPVMKDNLLKLISELRKQGHPPTCLISDFGTLWTLEMAERAGIPCVELWTSNAMTHLIVTHLDILYSEGIFPEKGDPTKWTRENSVMLSHIPGLPPFSSELIEPRVAFGSSSDPLVQYFCKVGSCVKSAERILIPSMLELEPNAFKALEVQGILAYAIGPLPSHTRKEHSKESECIAWLNSQADSSVIYVAFGSVASFSVEEIQELAVGLEASGHPFLWVIREDTQKREELPQVLPNGFLERTSTTGLIISWAPQVEVLAHKAIAGFLSHCGWISTLESIWAGVPMLCCPRIAEQRLNSNYICNVWGVGLELGRTDTGGLERSLVETGIRALLQSEEGMKARSKAQEIMHLARTTCQPGGHSFTNLQKFYDDMRELSSKSSLHMPPN